MPRPLGGPVEGMISSYETVVSPVWNTENGFSKVGGHGQTEGDREIELEMERELGVKRGGGNKLKTCMC